MVPIVLVVSLLASALLWAQLRLPVAVISADATPGQIERLRAAGADHYWTKPLDVNTFLSVRDDALAKRGSRLAGRHA